jgi:hypothetical protein
MEYGHFGGQESLMRCTWQAARTNEYWSSHTAHTHTLHTHTYTHTKHTHTHTRARDRTSSSTDKYATMLFNRSSSPLFRAMSSASCTRRKRQRHCCASHPFLRFKTKYRPEGFQGGRPVLRPASAAATIAEEQQHHHDHSPAIHLQWSRHTYLLHSQPQDVQLPFKLRALGAQLIVRGVTQS